MGVTSDPTFLCHTDVENLHNYKEVSAKSG